MFSKLYDCTQLPTCVLKSSAVVLHCTTAIGLVFFTLPPPHTFNTWPSMQIDLHPLTLLPPKSIPCGPHLGLSIGGLALRVNH